MLFLIYLMLRKNHFLKMGTLDDWLRQSFENQDGLEWYLDCWIVYLLVERFFGRLIKSSRLVQPKSKHKKLGLKMWFGNVIVNKIFKFWNSALIKHSRFVFKNKRILQNFSKPFFDQKKNFSGFFQTKKSQESFFLVKTFFQAPSPWTYF